MRDARAGPLTRGLRTTGSFLLRVPWPLALVLLAGWGLLIWDLSSKRAPLSGGDSPWWELASNLAHAPLFGTLTLLIAALCLRRSDGIWPRPDARRVGLVLALALGYGVLDELHQSRVPGRDASVLDVLTDLVSAVLVLWIVFTLGRRELAERQLVARLGLGIAVCVASAALAMLS